MPGCNNHKYSKTDAIDPASGEMAKLYHPRRQKWEEHFAWGNDFSVIVGITSTGRAMVETLQLNRESLVNLRTILVMFGEHPPAEPED